MKTTAAILLFTLSSVVLMAQDNATMDVLGIGETRVQPDRVLVGIHLVEKDMKYNNTLKNLDKKTRTLLDVLKKAGLSEEQVKVIQFNVSPNHVYRDGRQYDSGFVARQQIEVLFSNTREQINSFYDALVKSKVDVPMDFSFTLSEEKKAEIRNLLIDNAVADAVAKAKRLASAAGLSLGRIVRVQYGQGQSFPGPVPLRMEMAGDAGMARIAAVADMDAKDIVMRDEVRMSWSFE